MGKFLRAIGFEKLSDEPLGDYGADVTPPARSSALSPVTVDRALSLPSAYRAIQLIAGMGAQLTLDVIRAGAVLSPAPSIVVQPDPWRPLSSFLERCLVSMIVDGNAFLLKHRDHNGTVVALEVLNPFHVFIKWNRKTGVKSYSVTDSRTGQTRPYTDADIEHVWMLEVPGHARGLGPITACRVAFGGILDVREYADAWFAKSDVPSGILTTDQRLDPEAAKAYKSKWLNPDEDDPTNGKTGPQIRVLGQGLSYDPITLKPADAQWLESQAFGVLDIARMFGLPGDYLLAAVEGSSLTYSNLTMIKTQFLETTLFPVYLRKLEAAITNILPRGQVAVFNTEAFLRPDAKTRAEIDKVYIDAGVYGGEYVRTRENITAAAPAPARAKEDVPA